MGGLWVGLLQTRQTQPAHTQSPLNPRVSQFLFLNHPPQRSLVCGPPQSPTPAVHISQVSFIWSGPLLDF